jgi:hypothetical protein
MKLIKIRTSDVELITRSLYGDDVSFLQSYDKDVNKSLDSLVAAVKAAASAGMYFKIQDMGGALMGFFTTDYINDNTSFFYIKKTARTQEYYQDFYKLVSETLFGNLRQSLGSVNVPDINSILSSTFVIPGPYKAHGTRIY